ncbi:MAG: hypothetical protein AAB676_09400 [Verrucomicrobiota bacterium]
MGKDRARQTTHLSPGDKWETRAPEEVGLERARLDAFRDFVGGRGCVVRHGYMVYAWGDQALRGNVYSACKPWFSHFLFKAVGRPTPPGLFAEVDLDLPVFADEAAVCLEEERAVVELAGVGFHQPANRWRQDFAGERLIAFEPRPRAGHRLG